MYDVKALEAKWRLYKRKRRLKKILLGSSLSLLLVVPFLFWVFTKSIEKKADTQVSASSKKNIQAPVAIKPKWQEATAIATLSLKPKVKDIQSRQILVEQVEVPVKSTQSPKMAEIPILDAPAPLNTAADRHKNRVQTANQNSTKRTDPVAQVHKKAPKLKIIIKESSSSYALDAIRKRFGMTHRASDALFLARQYYLSKNFQEAEDWSFKANKLDSSLQEAWLLFAKSKVKLGKTQEAISVLRAYYANSRSSKAKRLLEMIMDGKFR